MIVALTPNSVIDYTLRVPGLELNKTVRASAHAWGMGGKANDAASILGQLAVPVLALGFAAGSTGERMEHMLREAGVLTDFVWVDGETRLSVVLVCSDGSGQSTFSPSSLSVSADHLAQFRDRYRRALDHASCLVLGGSLPAGVEPDFYRQVIAQARQRDIPVIFDSSGPALKAGLKSRPSLIKPNREELGDLVGTIPVSLAEVQSAARRSQQEFGVDVIATLGHEGALAVLGELSYFVPPLSVPVASAAGAGDGVLAGMALAYERGEPLENGLRHGFALAGAVVQTLGTADFRIEDYRDLLSQVELIALENKGKPAISRSRR